MGGGGFAEAQRHNKKVDEAAIRVPRGKPRGYWWRKVGGRRQALCYLSYLG